MRFKKITLRIIVVLMSTYVLLHCALSRSSLYILRKEGIVGFYYVPCSTQTLVKSKKLEMIHQVASVFFAPAWKLDSFLGGPSPCSLPDVSIGENN